MNFRVSRGLVTKLFLKLLSHDRLRKVSTIKKHLFFMLAPAALAVVGAVMNYATPAAGATPVGNPGKGTTPAPDVNVVNVTNPATAPVLMLNVNDPGRIPYQVMHTITTPLGNHQFASPFPPVPDGHRLVVQHVSGQVFFGDSPTAVTVTLTYLVSDAQMLSIFPVPNSQAFDQPVLAYYDAGENPMVIITTDPQSEFVQPTKFVGVTLSGYLVDCNIGPCAAITK